MRSQPFKEFVYGRLMGLVYLRAFPCLSLTLQCMIEPFVYHRATADTRRVDPWMPFLNRKTIPPPDPSFLNVTSLNATLALQCVLKQQ